MVTVGLKFSPQHRGHRVAATSLHALISGTISLFAADIGFGGNLILKRRRFFTIVE
jgi:hypothetical protein